MRILRLTLVALVFASVAACNDGASPTASVQPDRPGFDSSGMVGSGNRDGSTTITTSASDTTTVSRNSGMVGSGN